MQMKKILLYSFLSIGISYTLKAEGETSQSFTQKLLQTKTAQFIIQNIILPVHLKIESIKEEGVTKKDVAVAVTSVVAFIASMKAWQYFKLSQAVRGNTAPMRQAYGAASMYVHDNRSQFYAGAIAVTTAALLWYAWHCYQAYNNRPLVHKFLDSLEPEQCDQIHRCTQLKAALSGIHHDPRPLHTNEQFTSILTHEQKSLLDHTVNDYINSNPHTLLENLD